MTEQGVKGLAVHGDGTIEWGVFDYDSMRAHVGGWLDVVGWVIETPETVPVRVDMFVHDSGKLDGLPTNDVATRIAHHWGAIFADDDVRGPVVIVGGPDREGNETDLPAHAAAWILDAAVPGRPPVRVAPTYWQQAAELVAQGVEIIAVGAPDEYPPPAPEA